MRSYHAEVLGTFRCRFAGQDSHHAPSGKLQALLAYLLLHPNVPISRKYLAYLYWPDSTEQQASTNLRKLLFHLKRMIPEAAEALQLQSGQVLWKATPDCCVDALQFREEASSHSLEQLRRAASRYRGELLPGQYDEWILALRNELALMYVSVLYKLIGIYRQQKAGEQAVYYALKLVQHDALSEEAHLILIECYLGSGNRTAAERQYRQLQTMLENEWGMPPSQKTVNRLEQLFQRQDGEQPAWNAPLKVHSILRKKEMASLTSMARPIVERHSGGNHVCVLLQGEEGMGKTCLTDAFLEWGGSQGATVRKMHCRAAGGMRAYAPIEAWLEGMDLTKIPDHVLSELSRLAPKLLSEFSDLVQPASIQEAWELRRMYQAVEQVLGAEAKPLLLAVEDLQWAEPEMLQFLSYLLRPDQSLPLLLIGTVRSGPTLESAHLQAFVEEQRADRRMLSLELEPLTYSEAEQMIQAYADIGTVDIRWIYWASGGNPLYIHTYIQHGVGASAEAGEQMRKLSLEQIFLRRVRSMPEDHQQLLYGLSLLNKPASLSFMVRLANAEAGSEDAVLLVDQLIKRKMLKPAMEGRFEFSHEKLRGALSQSLPPASRASMHAGIAEKMANAEWEKEGGFASEDIASHYEAAGECVKAVPYWENAAQHASRLYNHDKTTYFCKKILNIQPESRLALNLLADTYALFGSWKSAEVYCLKLRDSSGPQLSLSHQGWNEIRLSRCLLAQGKYKEALSALERAEYVLSLAGDTAGQAEGYRRKCEIYIYQSEFDKAALALEQSRQTGGNAGDEALYTGLKADLLYERANYKEALKLYQQQIRMMQEGRKPVSLSKAFFGIALTYMETEQYALAFQSIEECRRISQSVGDRVGMSLSLGILGKIYLRAGWTAEALPCLLYSLREALRGEDLRSVAILSGLAGFALQELRADEPGLRLLEHAEALSHALHIPLFAVNSLYYLAHYYTRRESWKRAKLYVAKAKQLTIDYPRKDLACHLDVMEVVCSASLRKDKRMLRQQLTRLLNVYPSRRDQVMLHQALWEYGMSEESRDQALNLLQSSFEDQAVPVYQKKAEAMKGALAGEPQQPPALPKAAVAAEVEIGTIIHDLYRVFDAPHA